MDSILLQIKEMLGVPADYNGYDTAIISHINTAIFTLCQLGLPFEGFVLTDSTDIWTDLIGENTVESVKSYIYLKVRLLFDPPVSSFLVSSINEQLNELTSRLFMHFDTPPT